MPDFSPQKESSTPPDSLPPASSAARHCKHILPLKMGPGTSHPHPPTPTHLLPARQILNCSLSVPAARALRRAPFALPDARQRGTPCHPCLPAAAFDVPYFSPALLPFWRPAAAAGQHTAQRSASRYIPNRCFALVQHAFGFLFSPFNCPCTNTCDWGGNQGHNQQGNWQEQGGGVYSRQAEGTASVEPGIRSLLAVQLEVVVGVQRRSVRSSWPRDVVPASTKQGRNGE